VAISRGDSASIISYVRERRRLRPHEGQRVSIRLQNQVYESFVQSVGPQVELVPIHHLKNPTIPERAIPVRIQKPLELDLRPGELVPVMFN
jgi:hypothetical protein